MIVACTLLLFVLLVGVSIHTVKADTVVLSEENALGVDDDLDIKITVLHRDLVEGEPLWVYLRYASRLDPDTGRADWLGSVIQVTVPGTPGLPPYAFFLSGNGGETFEIKVNSRGVPMMAVPALWKARDQRELRSETLSPIQGVVVSQGAMSSPKVSDTPYQLKFAVRQGGPATPGFTDEYRDWFPRKDPSDFFRADIAFPWISNMISFQVREATGVYKKALDFIRTYQGPTRNDGQGYLLRTFSNTMEETGRSPFGNKVAKELLAKFPSSIHARYAAYAVARNALTVQDYEKALDLFEKVTEGGVPSGVRTKSLLQQGRTFYHLERDEEALALLLPNLEELRASPWGIEAMDILIKIYSRRSDYEYGLPIARKLEADLIALGALTKREARTLKKITPNIEHTAQLVAEQKKILLEQTEALSPKNLPPQNNIEQETQSTTSAVGTRSLWPL